MIFKLILRPLSLLLLVARAKKHNSLTDLGIATAVVTGIIHSIHPLSLGLVLLFAFYLSGTRFTKYKHEIKKNLTATEEPAEAAPRNHVQVLANSVIASVLIICHLIWQKDVFIIGIIANYVAVCADTWSSELGILSKSQPILITTLRPCPKGTNGGVSPLGFGVAMAGGAYIGAISAVMLPGESFLNNSIWARIFFILAMAALGLFGSTVDSVLGALLQKSVVNKQGKIIESANGGKLKNGAGNKTYSGSLDVLTNNQVNLLMAGITSTVAMALYVYF